MGNANEIPTVECRESLVTQGDIVKDDEGCKLEKKVEDLQSVVARRNWQIKELKVKLGKRERELDRVEKDLDDERHRFVVKALAYLVEGYGQETTTCC